MKKTIALVIAFVIVAAVTGGLAYGIGRLFDIPSLCRDGAPLIIGLCGGLGGVFGPILAALLSRLYSKRFWSFRVRQENRRDGRQS